MMCETVAVTGTPIATSPNLNYPVFSYDVTLTAPLSVAAGTKLWLSVVESDPTTNVTWSWEFHDDLTGNKVAYQSSPGGPLQLSFNDYDVAFTVLGNPAPVPEPSTIVLASVGGLTLLVGRSLRPLGRTKSS